MMAMLTSVIFLFLWASVSGNCNVPDEFIGHWYSQETGEIEISSEKFGKLSCMKTHTHRQAETGKGPDVTVLMKHDGPAECYMCVDILWRTPNVLQYHKETCMSRQRIERERGNLRRLCKSVHFDHLPSNNDLQTLFNTRPTHVNCESTTQYEAIFQFTYQEDRGSQQVCDNPNSIIRACEKKEDWYEDNRVFYMNTQACPDVPTSQNKSKEFHCLGAWTSRMNQREYTFAAIDGYRGARDQNDRFKCLISERGKYFPDGKPRWGMSRYADCKSLQSLYAAPIRLVLEIDRNATDRVCK